MAERLVGKIAKQLETVKDDKETARLRNCFTLVKIKEMLVKKDYRSY